MSNIVTRIIIADYTYGVCLVDWNWSKSVPMSMGRSKSIADMPLDLIQESPKETESEDKLVTSVMKSLFLLGKTINAGALKKCILEPANHDSQYIMSRKTFSQAADSDTANVYIKAHMQRRGGSLGAGLTAPKLVVDHVSSSLPEKSIRNFSEFVDGSSPSTAQDTASSASTTSQDKAKSLPVSVSNLEHLRMIFEEQAAVSILFGLDAQTDPKVFCGIFFEAHHDVEAQVVELANKLAFEFSARHGEAVHALSSTLLRIYDKQEGYKNEHKKLMLQFGIFAQTLEGIVAKFLQPTTPSSTPSSSTSASSIKFVPLFTPSNVI